jgi:hypothetical protein
MLQCQCRDSQVHGIFYLAHSIAEFTAPERTFTLFCVPELL